MSFSSISQLLPIALTHKCQPPECSPSLSPQRPHWGPFFSSPSTGLGRSPDTSAFPKAPTEGQLPGRHLSQAKNDLPPRMMRQTDRPRLMVFHQGISQSFANSLPMAPLPSAGFLSQPSLGVYHLLCQPNLFSFFSASSWTQA